MLLISGQVWSQTESFFENFDNVTTPDLPSGWTSIVETTSSGTVKTGTLYTPYSSPNHVQMNNLTDLNAVLILVSPQTKNFETNWLTLFTKLSGATHTADLVIGIMSDPADKETFIPIETIAVSGNVYLQKFVSFPEGYTDNDVYHIAFKFESSASLRNLLLDDIAWEEAPVGPDFTFTPESGDFSWADVNGNRSRTFVITNTGTGTLTVNQEDVSFSGIDADYFSVGESTEFPMSLTTGSSSQLHITFTPLSSGAKSATLSIAHNADVSPFTLELTGQGLPLLSEYEEGFDGSTSFPAGWSAIAQATTTFAGVSISTSGTPWSPPNNVRIANSSDLNALLLLVGPRVNNFEENWVSFYGRQNLATHEEKIIVGVMTDRYDADTFVPIDSVMVVGNVHQFYGLNIPEGYTNADQYHIAFKSVPTFTNRILFMDDISWGPKIDNPELTITPEVGEFGNIYLGQTSDPIQFVVSNNSLGTIQILEASDIFISGLDASAFELTLEEDLSFPISLTTGENFNIQATFSPTELRPYTAVLNIVDDVDTKGVKEIPLSGMGYDPTVTPYVFYDFIGGFPPDDWKRFSGLLEEASVLSPVNDMWVHDSFGNDGDINNSARINIWGNTRKHWLVTPPIDLTAAGSDYQMEFDLALTPGASSTPTGLGEDQFIAVVISTDGGLTWSSDNILKKWTHEDNISPTGDNIGIDLKDYDSVVKIGFYAESLSGDYFESRDIFVTNVAVKEREAYNLSFSVIGEAGEAINDAQVVFDGMDYSAGLYTFNDIITGNYYYSVSKEGYLEVNGQVSIVDQDVTVEIVLFENPTYTLTFDVKDENLSPVTDAIITLDGVAFSPGEYEFVDLQVGTYNYTIEKEGFEIFTGEAVITNEDIIEEVILTALPVYTVTFVVEDEDNAAINDAVITFDGEIHSAGIYVFDDLLAATYSYSVARSGFYSATGEVVVTDQDVTVNVVLEEAPYILTLIASPGNGGTTTGAGQYFEGTEALIEAISAVGYHFISWTDPDGTVVSNNAMETITMPAENYTLTANFALTDYTVSLSSAPENAGSLTGEGTYNLGEVITVTAEAASGYAFINWTNQGIEVSDETEYAFSMPAEDVNLTANFEPLPFELTIVLNPTGAGVVTGGGTHLFATDVTLNASPNPGYAFVNWTNEEGTEVANQEEYSFSMPAEDITLTANFIMVEYTLTLLVEPAEAGTIEGGGNYTMGSFVMFSATPGEGYEFLNWTDANGDEISANASHFITMPAADLTYTANFAPLSYELSTDVTPEGAGTTTGDGTYVFGEEVTVSAMANEGFEFEQWTDNDGVVLSEEEEYSFQMPASDFTVVAHFVPLTFELSLNVFPEGSGTVSGAGIYPFGEEVSVTAIANEGFIFENWTDNNGVVLSEDEQYSFIMPAQDLVLEANFASTVSVDEVALTDIRIYPNPSRNIINVESNENIREIRVYNLGGKLAFAEETDQNSFQLNVDTMKPGIYLLQVRTFSGIATHRIQVIN